MCLSLVLIVATVSSVNVAIPKLAGSSLNPSNTQILWIVDAYALVFAALLLPAGAIGDRFGRKGALLTGLVIFIVASASCAFMGERHRADRLPRGDGHRRSADHAVHAEPPAVRVPASRTGEGHRHVGRLRRCRRCHRPADGRLPRASTSGTARCSSWLRPSRRSRSSPRRSSRPRRARPSAGPLDFGGAALSIVGFGALLAAIIEGPERGWSDAVGGRRLRRRRDLPGRLRVLRTPSRAPDARHALLRQPPVRDGQPRASPRRSSRCSRCSSCSPSTCSS